MAHYKDSLQGSDKERVRDDMIGATVMTAYNKKMYVIDDLDFSKKVDDKFLLQKTNEQISYLDYYKKQWNTDIKDKNQFLIKSIDKKSKKVLA